MAKRKALQDLTGFVEKRRHRLRHPAFKRARSDMGRGPMASGGKHVIGRRLKGSGRKWTTGNAETMARLRAVTAGTGGWYAFWKAYHQTE